jgi:lysozyme
VLSQLSKISLTINLMGVHVPIEVLRRRMPHEHIVTDQTVSLIRGFEGLHLKAYPDPASELARTGKGSGEPWTIGYGHTKGVKPGDTCTLQQADIWLQQDADDAANIVRTNITVPLTAGEFGALTSLAFNLGYIPKSLKACLNGGVTDAGKVMTPGSYGSALLQFPRNCRAGGKPLKGLYRRRLAEACLFCDLPWENACSISVIKLQVTEGGQIDPNESTSLEDTLMRARLDTSKPPNTSEILKKPWSELVKKAEPEAVPATGEAEPAAQEAPQPNRPPLVSAPVPAPPSGPVAQAPAVVVPAPQPPPPPVKPAPPPKLPDPPVPIGQQTGAVDAARKSEEWSSSAKSMIYSRRFWGLLLVVAGRVWMLKTGSNAVLGAVSDPLVMEMFSGFMVMVIGEAVQHWGERKATRPLK